MGVLLAELGPQASYVDVDCPGTSVVLVAPNPAEQCLAGEDLARSGRQEPEQFVLHVGEVEDPARHCGLVGLEVEHQGSVLQQVRAQPAPCPPEEVRQPGGELVRVDRLQAQVVEEILAQLQLTQLARRDDDQHRSERHLARPEVPAEREGRGGVPSTADDSTGPAVFGLDPIDRLDPVDADPRVAGPIEHGSHRSRRKRRKAQQWLHGGAPLSSGRRPGGSGW